MKNYKQNMKHFKFVAKLKYRKLFNGILTFLKAKLFYN